MPNVTLSAELPLGFQARFGYSPERGLSIDWSPRHPNAQEARKVYDAFVAHREEFFELVASQYGPVILFDLDVDEIRVVEPPGRH
jgi:hypothetical protein